MAEECHIIFAINEPYMSLIASGEKTYEFRKYSVPATHIWFYTTAPDSHIRYVCEVDAALDRKMGGRIAEKGSGNEEYNNYHPDWDRYDYAYRIRATYELKEPIKLSALEQKYGFSCAPRSRMYTPASLVAGWKNGGCDLFRKEVAYPTA